MTKKQKKEIDNRINVAYRTSCAGIEINIMDIVKVFSVGRKAIENGASDEELRVALRSFVETLRRAS